MTTFIIPLVLCFPSGALLESVTEFTIDAKSLGSKIGGTFKVEVTLPSGGLTEGQVISHHDGTYTVLYTPFEEGQRSWTAVIIIVI